MQRLIKFSIIWLVMMCLICGCQRKERETAELLEEQEIATVQEELPAKSERKIVVYVCGAVVNEGVYELDEGSRVDEAIELAGGFAENAARSAVNRAAILKDEEKIQIPTLEEYENQKRQSGAAGGKVDLNRASKEELMTLPGIGESKAESIIRYREEQGRFQKVEDITNIEGIKDGLLRRIKDKVTAS